MKKYISKLYVLLVFAVFIMMAASCGKADTTNKVTDTIESSKDITGEEKETLGNVTPIERVDPIESTGIKEKSKPTVSVEPTGETEPIDNSETTENANATETANPTESAQLTENPEPTIIEESLDNMELYEEIQPIESVEPLVITDLEIIKETVLFDRDGIRVTAKGIVYNMMYRKELNLLIENDTDKNIGMMLNTLVVNNYMIDDFFSCGIGPRSTINEVLPLGSVGISVIGINAISEVAISLNVFDNDSGATLFISEEGAIPTSEYGKIEQPAMEGGIELWNHAGVRIVGKYVDEYSPWGNAALFYIENSSEENILIQCDTLSINGLEAIPFFFCLVNKGREALDSISIMNYMEENAIQEVKEIGFTLSIVDPINNMIIYQSEPLQLTVVE